MATYNGIELVEFNYDKPVTFEPAKKMLVWRESSSEPPHEENVLYVNSRYKIVVAILESGGVTMFEYCAEIPEKPAPRRATNRELAKWIAVKGEYKYIDSLSVCSGYSYPDGAENDYPKYSLLVRKWDDTEWHEPDVEYMGIAEVKTYEDVVKREG